MKFVMGIELFHANLGQAVCVRGYQELCKALGWMMDGLWRDGWIMVDGGMEIPWILGLWFVGCPGEGRSCGQPK